MTELWVDALNSHRKLMPSAMIRNYGPDDQAMAKMVAELIEFYESGYCDPSEVADVVYYAAGAVEVGHLTQEGANAVIENVLDLYDGSYQLEPHHAHVLALAKYQYRYEHGKNKAQESELMDYLIGEFQNEEISGVKFVYRGFKPSSMRG